MSEATQLLHLAAKAVGIEYASTESSGLALIRGGYWNPRKDDGDSRRLAVALRLTCSWDKFDGAEYATATPPHTHQGYDCIVKDDPNDAARQAVLLAAAAIGKEMQ